MRRGLLTLALSVCFLLATSSFAAPPSGSASAPGASGAGSAAAPPEPSASASPPASASEVPSAGLPPGHPPAGHPPKGQRPHAEFEAPEDGTIDDPSLPVGTLVATLRDAESRPVVGADLVLHILESSVTKGDSAQQRRGKTNERGEVRFDGLTVASAMAYKVSIARGGARFETDPRPLGRESGVRALLHVYESSAAIDDVMVAMFAGFSVSLREDTLQVEEVLQIINGSAVAWLPSVAIPLPAGAKAWSAQDTNSLVSVKEKDGVVRLEGTVGPGRSSVAFRYQVPLEGDGSQTLDLKLPPRVGAARVIAEVGGKISLDVPTFPPAQPEPTRDGRKVLVTERRVQQAELALGGIPALVIKLSGLPKKPDGPWIAVALAVGIAGLGLLLAFGRRGGKGAVAEDKDDLLEAREVLVRELDELDRARDAGTVGPKSYERVRAALLEAIARVLERLEALEPKPRATGYRDSQRPRKKKAQRGGARAV